MVATRKSATLSAKGQVSIPQASLQRLGLRDGDVLDVEDIDGGVILRVHAKPLSAEEAASSLQKIRGALAHLRSGQPALTVDEMSARAMEQAVKRFRKVDEG
jgi:AbrB family looped-hinge helix DNA binding protein